MPGFAPASWFALLAVAGTPPETVKQINAAVTKVLLDPVFKTEYLDKNGMEAIGGPPEQLAALIKTENRRWGEVIRGASIKLE
jgi:tripartite-type tricarboxylate transporter receptor subunit TctC